MTTITLRRLLDWVVSLLTLMLGTLVLIGWYTHSVLLIQIHPSFVPMQYNTALGFLLSGLGFFAYSYGYKKIATVAGTLLALIGGLTLVQYLFGVNLGIDQLLMEHYITVQTSHPGRMAPNTALSFLLVGLCLMLSVFVMKGQKKEIIRTLLGSAVFALGVVAFFGYLLDLEAAYGWQSLTRMAVHTSAGFILLSIGILGNVVLDAAPASKRLWLPIPASVSLFLIFVLFTQAFHQKEEKQIEKNILLEERLIAEQIQSVLQEHEKLLLLISKKYADYQEIPKKEWFATAQLLYEDLEGLVEIRLTDMDHIPRWTYPQREAVSTARANVPLEEQSRSVIDRSLQEKTVVASRTIDLLQGGKGFLLALPMFSSETFTGHILFLFRIDKIFRKVIENTKQKFHVVILEENGEVYDVAGHTVTSTDITPFTMTPNQIGYNWIIEIRPVKMFVDDLKTGVSEFVLFFGFLVSSLFGLMLYFLLLKNEKSMALHHQAYHDALTGLPNRLLFMDRLDQYIHKGHRNKSKIAVLFVDMDRFKEINDSLGHAFGDKAIKEVARRIESQIRETDTIARFGGDEFIMICNDIDNPIIVVNIIQKVMQSMADPIIVEDHSIYITLSIGISIYPDDADMAYDLLKNADAAMYKAKNDGRNTYRFYTEDMTEKAFARIKLESSLRQAIKDEDLILYFQPQFNAKTNTLIGMETLVRWEHSSMGFIPPSKFIPIAEDTGLIIPLGIWILKKGMQQIVQWHDDGLTPGTLAINFSMLQLQKHDFISMLEKMLNETMCKPQWIEVEITESQVMKNPEKTISTLQKISQLGIKIAIDDFGTGYSSLSYLKRFPINRLKIDRSFIQDIPEDEEDMAIVQAIIALAKSLNLDVIAEGVETEEQKDFLVKNGCKNIQGYYYARPIPADKIMEMLLKR